MWPQTYTPLGDSLPLSAIAAALPIFVLLILLGIFRRPACNPYFLLKKITKYFWFHFFFVLDFLRSLNRNKKFKILFINK